MANYPYTHMVGIDAGEGGRVYVLVEVQPDGLSIDEESFISAVRSALLGQAGIASVTATRYAITGTQV